MGRRDLLDDPNAPKANRLVPAASAIVLDEAGRILLHKRMDNEYWSIPGGAMEPGETIAETIERREAPWRCLYRPRGHLPGAGEVRADRLPRCQPSGLYGFQRLTAGVRS
jgi:hypothetical protein